MVEEYAIYVTFAGGPARAGDTAARALADVARATRLHVLLTRCVMRMRAQAASAPAAMPGAAQPHAATPDPAAAVDPGAASRQPLAPAPPSKKRGRGGAKQTLAADGGKSESLDEAPVEERACAASVPGGPSGRGEGAGLGWEAAGSGRVRIAEAGAVRAVLEAHADAAAAHNFLAGADRLDLKPSPRSSAAVAGTGDAGLAANGPLGAGHAQAQGSVVGGLPALRVTIEWAGGWGGAEPSPGPEPGAAVQQPGPVRCRMHARECVPPAVLRVWEDMAGAELGFWNVAHVLVPRPTMSCHHTMTNLM